MASIPFALSVSHFVDSVGAKAGFAAIIGLAILVLLFFSQARETSNLRRHAAESDEHVQQLELRVAQLAHAAAAAPATASPPVAPAPASVQRRPVAPPPAGVAGAAAAPALVASRSAAPPAVVPTAPAGVGAPAMSSATRLIPTGDGSEGSLAGTAAAAAAAAVGIVAAESGGDHYSGAAVASAGPAPATAAGGANGGQTNSVPAPAVAPAPPPPSARSGQQQPRSQARTASTRPGGAPPGRSGGGSRGPSRIRPIAYAVAGVIAIAAIVVALLVLTSQSSNTSSSSSASQAAGTHNGKHRGRAAGAIKPADVTVAVLNGTSTPNLAHDTGQRLIAAGYKVPTTGNASDQTQSATVVGYLPGHRAAALLVARALKLGSASVQPVAQANEAVACPQASTCTTKVVVNVGADLASTATTSAASTT